MPDNFEPKMHYHTLDRSTFYSGYFIYISDTNEKMKESNDYRSYCLNTLYIIFKCNDWKKRRTTVVTIVIWSIYHINNNRTLFLWSNSHGYRHFFSKSRYKQYAIKTEFRDATELFTTYLRMYIFKCDADCTMYKEIILSEPGRNKKVCVLFETSPLSLPRRVSGALKLSNYIIRQLNDIIYACKSFKHNCVITMLSHSAETRFQNIVVALLRHVSKDVMPSFVSCIKVMISMSQIFYIIANENATYKTNKNFWELYSVSVLKLF